jgi:hypothetical protein
MTLPPLYLKKMTPRPLSFIKILHFVSYFSKGNDGLKCHFLKWEVYNIIL